MKTTTTKALTTNDSFLAFTLQFLHFYVYSLLEKNSCANFLSHVAGSGVVTKRLGAMKSIERALTKC